MNKDLFKIESDEVRRILSLHEERTKTQYLNIINEDQEFIVNKVKSPQFKTTKPHAFGTEGFIPAGTVFKPKDDKNVIATNVLLSQFAETNAMDKSPATVGGNYYVSKKQPKKITINFYCRNKEFNIVGKQQKYGSTKSLENKIVTTLCGKEPLGTVSKDDAKKLEQDSLKSLNAVYIIRQPFTIGDIKLQNLDYVKKGTVPSILNIFRGKDKLLSFNCLNKNFFLGDKIKLDVDKKLTTTLLPFCTKTNSGVNNSGGTNNGFKFDVLYIIKGNYNVGNTPIKANDTVIKSSKYQNTLGIMRNNSVIIYFNCSTGVFSGNATETPKNNKTYLTNTLKSNICPQILSSSNINTGGTNTGGTNTGGGSNRQSRFIANTQTKINNVQKLLGVTPTGQLDTTQIDTLINKLKG